MKTNQTLEAMKAWGRVLRSKSDYRLEKLDKMRVFSPLVLAQIGVTSNQLRETGMPEKDIKEIGMSEDFS